MVDVIPTLQTPTYGSFIGRGVVDITYHTTEGYDCRCTRAGFIAWEVITGASAITFLSLMIFSVVSNNGGAFVGFLAGFAFTGLLFCAPLPFPRYFIPRAWE